MVNTTVSGIQAALHDEIDRWERLGVAVLPGPWGRKGPRIEGWPSIPPAKCWELSRAEVTRRRINIVARTGVTASGDRYLAAIDLDGKCPCGHDRTDHTQNQVECTASAVRSEPRCGCEKYRGVAPEAALAGLLKVLPPDVAITRTARGFHLIFWAKNPVPDAKLADYSADLFGGLRPHALQLPPSLHPSGLIYEWHREPGDDLPVVDLDALGLAPSLADTSQGRRTGLASSRSGTRPDPADPALRSRFTELMAGVGLVEGQGHRRDGGGEFFVCPWHADSEASLHVLWESAVFWCHGCEQGGGVRALLELIGGVLPISPRKFPNDASDVPSGEGVTYGGLDPLSERIASLAEQLPVGTFNVGVRELRDCRQMVLTYECDEGHQFAPRDHHGEATPLSCDASAGICPRCGTARFLVDARAADGGLPWRVHVFRLVARTPGRDLLDTGLSSRLTERLKQYRKSHGPTAGNAARSLHLESGGTAFRGHFILAVPVDLSAQVVADGAFAVEDLGEQPLEEWHRLQVEEYLAALAVLETPEQLEAFYRSSHGQQRFRHFGDWYGRRVDETTGELLSAKSAGGAGGNHQRMAKRVVCPTHPTARVWRSPTPAPRQSLMRVAGGALVPRVHGPDEPEPERRGGSR